MVLFMLFEWDGVFVEFGFYVWYMFVVLVLVYVVNYVDC